jgi:uncharacterized protein YegP (UPF0339 family)
MIFIIRPTDFGHYQFSLSMNESLLLTSLQTFPTLSQCKDSIDLLKESLNYQNRLCSTYSSIGGHYFYVCDEHRDPIVISDIFSSKTSMKRCMQLVLKSGSSARVEDSVFKEFYISQTKQLFSDLVA